jgi:hypothetical protein
VGEQQVIIEPGWLPGSVYQDRATGPGWDTAGSLHGPTSLGNDPPKPDTSSGFSFKLLKSYRKHHRNYNLGHKTLIEHRTMTPLSTALFASRVL